MILFWCILALALAGWLVWRAFGMPLLDLRETIRAIANDELRRPIVRTRSRMLMSAAGDLGRIADRLRRQSRQLADEGFSLRAILGSMAEGVAIMDTSQRIRMANDALQEMFALHRPPDGRTALEVFHLPEFCAAAGRSLRELRPVNLEVQDEARIGDRRGTRYFRIQLTPLMQPGADRPAGVVAVFVDVTEIRALETVRRDFVANVSHEFRTPLAIINGYVETLLDGALEDREMAERSLGVILKNGDRLNRLIEDLLTIARMERAEPLLQVEPCNLAGIARRVVEQLEGRVAENGMAVSVDFSPEAEKIEADAARIEQAFFNLLSNALQYAVVEEPEVRIVGRRKGEEVEVSFADNGPGIPTKDQSHIFDRFYRVRKDRSRDAGGTGLGLSIVKNIALAHGGRVSLRSTPGGGATFKIVLPVKPPSR